MIGVLTAIWLTTASAGQSCDEKCATDSGKCLSGCGSNQKCTAKCDDRRTSCALGCQAAADKKQADKVSKASGACGMGKDMQPIACTPEQERQMKAELKAKEKELKAATCKGPDGEPMLCPDLAAKLEKHLKDVDSEDCTDASGKSIACPKKK